MLIINAVEGETVTFAATADVEFDGGTTGASATCLTDAAGECSVLATSSVAAAYTTTVSIAAGDLSNSPASFEFEAGAADTSTSTVAVAGSPATANGVASITLTATIEDADNNPVEGETVTFAATTDVEFDGGTTGASATCLTDAAGECFVLATSSIAATFTTTVTIAVVNFLIALPVLNLKQVELIQLTLIQQYRLVQRLQLQMVVTVH